MVLEKSLPQPTHLKPSSFLTMSLAASASACSKLTCFPLNSAAGIWWIRLILGQFLKSVTGIKYSCFTDNSFSRLCLQDSRFRHRDHYP
jgi:hypothetical protein